MPLKRKIQASSPPSTRQSKQPKTKTELLVTLGLDFGTTLTCIAFTLCSVAYKADGTKVIREIDKATNMVRFNSTCDQQSKPFFENICAYDGEDLLLGDRAVEHAERVQIATSDEVNPLLRFLKLAICENININRLGNKDSAGFGHAALTEHLRKIRRASAAHGSGADPYTLVAKFIKQLYVDFIKRDIFDTYKFTQPGIIQSKVDIVVTRPSIWTFTEDQRLVTAVEQALDGATIGDIAVFDEAHAVLTGMISDDQVSKELSKGSVVLVLDIGGGTADLASIRIQKKNPLRLCDAGVSSSGGVFGATIVVAFFEQDIRKFIKPVYEHWTRHDSSPNSRTVSWTRLCQDLTKKFESSMKAYKGLGPGEELEDVSLRLNCADLPEIDSPQLTRHGYKMTGGLLGVTHSAVQRLFKPCLNGIISLSRTQIQATQKRLKESSERKGIKGLFVVGGFSKNAYLNHVLIQSLSDLLPEQYIWFPPKFEKSAVAIGAMKYAKNRKVLESRVLQASVGFEQAIEWDYQRMKGCKPPRQFQLEMSAYHTEVDVLLDSVRWVFLKGQPVGQKAEGTFSGVRYLPKDGTDIVIEEDVYCSPDSREDFEHDGASYGPANSPTAQITKVGTLRFTIERPSQYWWYHTTHSFKANDGTNQIHVQYEITVKWNGLRLEWILEIPASGHYDCAEFACPGAEDEAKCPSADANHLTLRKEGQCNLGAAFGDEQANSVEAIQDAATFEDLASPLFESKLNVRAELSDDDYVQAWAAT